MFRVVYLLTGTNLEDEDVLAKKVLDVDGRTVSRLAVLAKPCACRETSNMLRSSKRPASVYCTLVESTDTCSVIH